MRDDTCRDDTPDDPGAGRSADVRASVTDRRAERARAEEQARGEHTQVIEGHVWALLGCLTFVIVAFLTGGQVRKMFVSGFDPILTINRLWPLAFLAACTAWVLGREGRVDPRWHPALVTVARAATFHRYWLSVLVVGMGTFGGIMQSAQVGLEGPHTWAWRIAASLAFAAALLTAAGLYDVGKPNPDLIREQRLQQIGKGIAQVFIALLLAGMLASLHKPLVHMHGWEREKVVAAAKAEAAAEEAADKAPAEKPDLTPGGITVDPGQGGRGYDGMN